MLGLLLVALALWIVLLVFRPPAPAAAPRRFASSQECRACHAALFAEWEASQHARSWTNPEVRALSNDFANTDCIDCHAPRPLFETGVGKRVLPRAARRAEGVDCIACHLLPDGRVAGTVTNDAVACRPIEVRELVKPEFCAACHDQHQTVEQWRASAWAAEGVDCSGCHLPERERALPGGGSAAGRDHGMWGGHDLALVASAVALRARRAGGAVVVEVENVRAGHHFPTDERSRAGDLFWRPLDGQGPGGGRGAWRHLWRFRSPYRHEVDLPDTLLPAHETKRVVIEDPEAAGALEVALFYKRSPYWEDPERPDPEREAFLLHALELAPAEGAGGPR
jgi:hypothetical protein